MKTIFEWKKFSDEMPIPSKLIVICSRFKKKVGFHIGTYEYSRNTKINGSDLIVNEFIVCKMNINTFTKQKRYHKQILDKDYDLYEWDYYNPYWKVPGTFDDINELFYKK